MKKLRIVILGLARRDRKWSLNDGQIQNPSKAFGIVPLSNFVPRGFGFVHHSKRQPFSITKYQTLISRFATFSSLYEGGAAPAWRGGTARSAACATPPRR
jgi:hypothetical protein